MVAKLTRTISIKGVDELLVCLLSYIASHAAHSLVLVHFMWYIFMLVALHIIIELYKCAGVSTSLSANAYYALNWFCVYASLVLSMPHQ